MYNSCLLELQSCWLVLALEFLRGEKSLSADDPGDQTLDRGEGLGAPDQAGEGVEHRVLGVLTNCPGRQEQPSPRHYSHTRRRIRPYTVQTLLQMGYCLFLLTASLMARAGLHVAAPTPDKGADPLASGLA